MDRNIGSRGPRNPDRIIRFGPPLTEDLTRYDFDPFRQFTRDSNYFRVPIETGSLNWTQNCAFEKYF